MTLHELLHSVSPEILAEVIKETSANNDVIESLELKFLPKVLKQPPAKSRGDCIYILRDRHYMPVVVFGSVLDENLSLHLILGRTVMVSDNLKHLSPARIAAYCFCALPVGVVVDPDSLCPASRAFDPANKVLITRDYDVIRLY